ncbi:MAG: hypothetical protein H7Z15_15870 [Rhizobacter sp.]|nr:hypothetical protein [Rhizobacter sp.]
MPTGAGAITAAGLPGEHFEDERRLARVDAVLAADHLEWLCGTWGSWKDVHLRHLAHERVLVPTERLPDFGLDGEGAIT